MTDEQKINELQRKIDNLSSQMKNYEQQVSALKHELNSLRAKDLQPIPPIVPRGTSQNFKFENVIGLRIIHLVGIVVLVIGLSIGVKYAIDRQLISEGARIICAYAAGVVLYVLSWRLKKKYQLLCLKLLVMMNKV